MPVISMKWLTKANHQNSWVMLRRGMLRGVLVCSFSCFAFFAQYGHAQTLVPLDWPSDSIALGTQDEADRAPVVTGIALQPNGPLVALVGDDHFVRLVERQSGRLVGKLHGHRDWIRNVVFTPDGKWLITAGNDRQILKWDATALGEPELIAVMDFAVAALSVDATSRFLAVGGFASTVHMFNLANDNSVLQIDARCSDIRAVAFSPDGTRLAAAGRDGTLRVWETATGDLKFEHKIHTRRIRDLEFLREGDQIVTCGEDLKIRITSLEHPEKSLTIDSSPAKVMTLQLMDGDLMASAGSDNQIRIWNLFKQEEVGQLFGHEGSVAALAFDGAKLYSAGYDTHLRIWRVNANFAAIESEGPRVSQEPGFGIVK